MVKVKRDAEALQRIISRLQREWQAEAETAANELYDLLDKGHKVESALKEIQKEHPALFNLPDLKDALVEAAAYGYGIVPEILTDAQTKAWHRNLALSWDASKMTLSQKLHGASEKMRDAIIITVRAQMRKNATWIAAARELYDGYNSGKAVTLEQVLPKYLEKVRRAAPGSVQSLAASRKAMRNIQRLSRNGAPTKSLKAAYTQLVKTAETGTSEALKKACWVAMQEKSRYVADRIIRTETARAWADGFWAEALKDDDVVAVKWKLSSRHPVFDICDMYAKADMFNLGPGVFPKDKAPELPVHPHCLCRIVEVYKGETKGKEKDQVQQAGNKWLGGLSRMRRQQVLGIEGEQAWQDGADWREFMRNWKELAGPETRLGSLMLLNMVPPTDEFIETLADQFNIPYTKGKRGTARFYGDNGKPIYPPNDGAVGRQEIITLKAGTIIVDRYGADTGKFVSPKDTPYEQRALPDGSEKRGYHVYRIIRDIESVQRGVIAAWFGQPGGGTQFKLPKSIAELSDCLKEEKP